MTRELEQGGRKESLQKLQKMVFPSVERKKAGYETLMEQYRSYKENYVRSLAFDPEDPNLSQLFCIETCWQILISASVIEHSQLEEVYIFFDAATYDEVERDVKVNSCLSLMNLT